MTGLTDVNGKLLQSYSYDAFGNALMTQGQGKGAKNIANPYGFSTKEYNPKSGLSYFGARYYDPAVGRFVTKDPLSWGPDDPRMFIPSVKVLKVFSARALQQGVCFAGSINPPLAQRYHYCVNNPANSIDPLGLWTRGMGIGATGGLGGGGTVQILWVWDDDGNGKWVITTGGGGYGGAGVSGGIVVQWTNADKVTDLKGPGFTKGGGSGGTLWGGSVEVEGGAGYVGFDISLPFGGGIAMWGFGTYSWVLTSEQLLELIGEAFAPAVRTAKMGMPVW